MKTLLLCSFLAMLILNSCEDSTSYGTGKSISAIKSNERILPDNTVKVIDYNTIAVQEQNAITVLDISDTSNSKIIYEFDITSGKKYYSIRLGRYLILEDRTGTYSQMIIDMQNGRNIDLKEEGFSSGGVSINPLDHSILYRLQYFHEDIRSLMSIIKYTTFDNQIITLMDSCTVPFWAPNRKWFATSKFMYKEGYFLNWEPALYNLNGDKVIITREPLVMYSPIWNSDGSALVYHIHGDGCIMIVEFDWINDKPKIKRKVLDSGFNEPLWSPDGNYLVYIKWYEDGHTTYGNDILVTDRNLLLRKTIIQHEDVIESPIFWNSNDGLVTSLCNKIVKYEIDNLY